jgi:hypothetical protein
MHIRDTVDCLFGVDHMRPSQNKRIGCGLHACAPCSLGI